MEVGSSIDTLCSVTFDVNLTWTQGEGGITVKLSVWYIVSFYRTSKLDLNQPSLFVDISWWWSRCGATSVKLRWAVIGGGRVTWPLCSPLIGQVLLSIVLVLAVSLLLCLPTILYSRIVRWAVIGGAAILTSDWSGRPTTGTSATCTGPMATQGTPSWTSCESCSISWIVWCYDIHMPFVQIRTSEEF